MDLIKTKSFKLAIRIKGSKKSKKLAILIPGRLDTKDYANFISHAEYLANKGFFAISFDPPGTWDSPGNIDIYSTTNYIKAVNELIEYFGNRPTLLLGHSRGGSVAIISSLNPVVTSMVLVMASYGTPSPPSDESKQAGFQEELRDLPPGSSKTSGQKIFLLPLAYWKDGKKYNPLQVLKKSLKPKLIIYGNCDEFTSVNKVKDVYNKIPEPKMIKEICSNHDYRYHPTAIKEVNNAIGQFLDRFQND